MTSLYLYLGALILAAATTSLATPLVIRFASHVGFVDQVGERRMHEVPKPRIGGLAVFFGFAFALFAMLGVGLSHRGFFVAHAYAHEATTTLLRSRIEELRDAFDSVHDLVGLLFGSMLILAVGLWDDVMQMRPRYKLLAQIVVAVISMVYGFHIGFVHNPAVPGAAGYVYFPPWISYPLTLVWYVGMMNAINFIDGLDGLLSGVTAISGLFLFTIAVGHDNPIVALVIIALVGATLGFLPYNFNPARIILGDTGSLFIGYVFATVSIIGASKQAIAISLLVPAIVLALPILDTAAAIVRRARSGKKITEADRGHFHHQLIFRFGLNVRQAVLLIYLVCFILGAAALLLSGGLPHAIAL